jgi:hypothetical protein
MVSGFLFLPLSARGQSGPGGVPVSVAASGHFHPTIISDGAGGAIFVWHDNRRGGGFDIYAQRVDASGLPLWPAGGIAMCTAANEQSEPAIVSDGVGGAIVAWQDYRSGVYPDIYAQRVNASGAPQWPADGVALCTADNPQAFPVIVSDGAGGAIVTWADARNGTNSDIYARRVDASGTPQWADNGIAISSAANNQRYPAIVADGSGGAIITWSDARSGNNADIYAQRVSASGASRWTADGVAVCTAADKQQYPSIVSDGVGGAIITWSDDRSGTNTDIYAQRMNTSGSAQWLTDGVALCATAGDQNYPKVTSDGAGGAIAAWSDYRSGNSDIYAQWVNASGTPRWGDGAALCTAVNNQEAPAIVSDGAGGAIVAWHDARRGSADVDIYVQRVNTSGIPLWETDGVAACNATNTQQYPAIISAEIGGAIITCQDGRNGANGDFYAWHVADPRSTGTQSAPAPRPSSTRVSATQAVAHDANHPSMHPRPLPDCKVFFLPNAGLYVALTKMNSYETPWRGVVDLGVMVNISKRDAIGASWFFIADDDGFTTGPAIRYRRWFERERSLDLAVGTPVRSSEDIQTGSIYGLIKYNPVHWFGVALRPEYVRRPEYSDSSGTYSTGSSGRVYAGVEFRGMPGLALSAAGVVVVAALIVGFFVFYEGD